MNQRSIEIELIDHALDLEELCRLCNVEPEVVTEWVAEGVVEPEGSHQWRFPVREIRRTRIAGRLQRDFELDTPSLPLVLDLLDEVETLRREVRILRRLLD